MPTLTEFCARTGQPGIQTPDCHRLAQQQHGGVDTHSANPAPCQRRNGRHGLQADAHAAQRHQRPRQQKTAEVVIVAQHVGQAGEKLAVALRANGNEARRLTRQSQKDPTEKIMTAAMAKL